LRAAGGGLEFAAIGLHAEITATDFYFPSGLNAFNDIVTDASCAVNPPIEAPGEAVHFPLLIFRAETGEEHFFHISLAVAVGDLGIENVRSCAYKSPPLPGHHAGGIGQVIEENRGLVIAAV